jgi:dipeptidyl aminopeptidase/acylaminoacyl peptidase
LLDVSGDGARALMGAFRSDDDIVLSEVDVATGHARQVFPAAGSHAGMYAAVYSADATRLFVSTDRDERVVLLELDVATGRELASYRDAIATSPIAMLAAPSGDVVAVGVDAGTHGEIRILDAQTLTLRHTVTVPLGEIFLGAFRPDGRAFSFSFSRPEQPDDPYAVDVATGTITPLRVDARAGIAQLPPIGVTIETTKAFDGLTIPINVYLPPHPTGARLPVIASFHGGPSASSAIHWSPSTRFYTSLGYAVIEPNVRGSTGFGRAYEMADNREKRADWLRDLATVNTWVKTQPWCDRDRVTISGGSYGGYTTLMALTRQPTAWRAGIDAFGPANLRTFLLTTDAAIRSGFIPEFGDVDKDAALLEQFSPMRDVDKIVRPLFVYAGQNDPRVPRSESDAIVGALRARHIPVEYMIAPNEGHSVDRAETRIQLLARISRFLEDALR